MLTASVFCFTGLEMTFNVIQVSSLCYTSHHNTGCVILYLTHNHQYPSIHRRSNNTMKAWIAVPIILVLVYRSWSHKSLTPTGIVAAVLTAIAHAIHPWNLPFALLIVFFLAGTRATKVCKLSTGTLNADKSQVKHDVKAKLTMQATGSPGGEGARTHVQGD